MPDELVHQGACVVRTPLLPFDTLLDGLTSERLRLLLANPVVREALFLASPSLDAAIDAWLANPKDPRAHDAELIIARYIARMASRSTPFGLFSGCAVATISKRTVLEIGGASESRRSSRLDMQYLALLIEAVERDPAARSSLRYRPNSSIVESDDELRYVEAHLDPTSRKREFRLVSVQPIPELKAALRAASNGATATEIAETLLRDDPNLSHADAAAFVNELIDVQLLQSNIQPVLTCDDPLSAFASAIERAEPTSAIANRIAEIRTELRTLDARGLGASREHYRAIMTALEPLPVPLDPARLFQVDLFKASTGLCLNERVVGEVRKAIGLLHRITPAREGRPIDRFRTRFTERYGDTDVPLGEALDEERGLGFDSQEIRTADPSPLLAGLALPAAAAASAQLTSHDEYKLQRWLTLIGAGQREWELDERDLAALDVPNRAPLPDAVAAMLTIAARSNAAIDNGEFELLIGRIGGPSGASLLGRFCHGDPAIRELVDRHLRAEEKCRPEAIFAEIVHLPEGRLGNVICRPVLRSHEIPYLGASGAPLEQQIPLDDLRVSIRHGKVRLRSVRLDREVLPRLTSAHNHPAASLAVYRFLCALQHEGLAAALGWTWGALADAPFLPRVKRGRLVLSLASWTIEKRELERASRETNIRESLRLPRWVCVVVADNVLPVDLERDGATEQLLALARGTEKIRLQELYPAPDSLCATGPDGRYAHEIIIPFTRAEPSTVKRLASARAPSPSSMQTFSPGSQWLYAKIYTGPTSAERVLRTVIAPLVRELRAANQMERWFFIRYADPEPHLRVRFEGDPDRLLREVFPLLRDKLAPLLASGLVARIQLDTYQREVERYGGPAAISIAEQIFEADSDAALAIVEATTGDAGIGARWRIALFGMHALLADAKVGEAARRTLAARARDAFAAEHRMDTAARRSVGARYRLERDAITRLLDGAMESDAELGPALSILRDRSAAMVPRFAELRALDAAGDLHTPWDGLLQSFLHMHVNRVVRDNQRTHEMVLYDFLFRVYDAAKARAAGST